MGAEHPRGQVSPIVGKSVSTKNHLHLQNLVQFMPVWFTPRAAVSDPILPTHYNAAKGPRGDKGPEGDKGIQGPEGRRGRKGPRGDPAPREDPEYAVNRKQILRD